jgi:SAM-dependent methyltransferase
MHYSIKKENEIVIKSEYAAKSIRQQSGWVIDWIKNLPVNSIVLDYGCGKLRYTIPLIQRVNEVIAVDSKEQLNRIQKIDKDKQLTIKEYSKSVSNLKVCSIEEFNYNQYFDWALCTNVLSAIPHENERIKVLQNIYQALKSNGKALITTQFRNSYFKLYQIKENAQNYNDGWIIKNKKGYSFYGIIPPNSLKELCLKAGITNFKWGSIGETAYIIIEKDF